MPIYDRVAPENLEGRESKARSTTEAFQIQVGAPRSLNSNRTSWNRKRTRMILTRSLGELAFYERLTMVYDFSSRFLLYFFSQIGSSHRECLPLLALILLIFSLFLRLSFSSKNFLFH